MGRNCGDIALYAGICGGAEAVIVPEEPFDKDQLIRTILEGKMQMARGTILIILAEGVGGAYDLAE